MRVPNDIPLTVTPVTPGQTLKDNAVADGDPEGQEASNGEGGEQEAASSSLAANGEQQAPAQKEDSGQAEQDYEHSQKSNPYRSLGDVRCSFFDRHLHSMECH
jgi:hypothetical protein